MYLILVTDFIFGVKIFLKHFECCRISEQYFCHFPYVFFFRLFPNYSWFSRFKVMDIEELPLRGGYRIFSEGGGAEFDVSENISGPPWPHSEKTLTGPGPELKKINF